jgi:hypothetical protein
MLFYYSPLFHIVASVIRAILLWNSVWCYFATSTYFLSDPNIVFNRILTHDSRIRRSYTAYRMANPLLWHSGPCTEPHSLYGHPAQNLNSFIRWAQMAVILILTGMWDPLKLQTEMYCRNAEVYKQYNIFGAVVTVKLRLKITWNKNVIPNRV